MAIFQSYVNLAEGKQTSLFYWMVGKLQSQLRGRLPIVHREYLSWEYMNTPDAPNGSLHSRLDSFGTQNFGTDE